MTDIFNNIEVVLGRSHFCKVEHHIIVIDGMPLDALLHNHYPSHYLEGLIPVMPDWLDKIPELTFTEPDYTSHFSKIYRLNGCSADKRE